jgi:hypothetical protein
VKGKVELVALARLENRRWTWNGLHYCSMYAILYIAFSTARSATLSVSSTKPLPW